MLSRPALLRYFTIALLVKGLWLFMFLRDGHGGCLIGHFAICETDTPEYTEPFEQLLSGAGYHPDYRMPGMGLVYLPLRLVLDRPTAADVLVLIQWLFASAAALALALIVLELTASIAAFKWALAVLIVFTFPNTRDMVVLTESFCASSISISAYFLVTACRRDGRWRWMMAGAFLTWAIFLRPIHAAFLVMVPCAILWLTSGRASLRMVRVLFFVLPFVLVDVPWTIRNYLVNDAFHPLTNGLYESSFMRQPYYPMQRFVTGYGGNHVYWDRTADICWYGFRDAPDAALAKLPDEAPEPPDYVLTSECDRDSLRALADLVRRTRDPSTVGPEREQLLDALHERTERYRSAFARERPFQYQVLARLRLLGHLTLHSGTIGLFQRPFGELHPWEKIFKLFQSLLYLFAFAVGTFGAVALGLRFWRDPAIVILCLFVLGGLLLHPFTVRLCEARYLIPSSGLTMMLALYVVMRNSIVRKLLRLPGTEVQ